MLSPLTKVLKLGPLVDFKKGGKSDRYAVKAKIISAVIVCSDTISRGEKEDAAKQVIKR